MIRLFTSALTGAPTLSGTAGDLVAETFTLAVLP